MNNMDQIRDLLFDKGQNEPIALVSASGKQMKFEQIYAAQFEGNMYCILRPLARVEGLRAQSALAFLVDAEGNLHAVKDRELSQKLFKEYYDALGGAQGRN